MNIIDLRQTTVRQIEPLLEEEARHWRDELHWDYRGALELIKRFLDAHALAGCVAFENGVAVGYSLDRKSTRLNSSHITISYAVFCLKKKKYTTKKTLARAIKHQII